MGPASLTSERGGDCGMILASQGFQWDVNVICEMKLVLSKSEPQPLNPALTNPFWPLPYFALPLGVSQTRLLSRLSPSKSVIMCAPELRSSYSISRKQDVARPSHFGDPDGISRPN